MAIQVCFFSRAVYHPSNIFIDSNGEMGVQFDVSAHIHTMWLRQTVFGSVSATITFVVKHAPTLALVPNDTDWYCNDTDVCASTEPFQDFGLITTHAKELVTIPEINDIIFIDGYGEQYLNGGINILRWITTIGCLLMELGRWLIKEIEKRKDHTRNMVFGLIQTKFRLTPWMQI